VQVWLPATEGWKSTVPSTQRAHQFLPKPLIVSYCCYGIRCVPISYGTYVICVDNSARSGIVTNGTKKCRLDEFTKKSMIMTKIKKIKFIWWSIPVFDYELHGLPYAMLVSLLSPTPIPSYAWIHAHVSWRTTALQYSLLHMPGRRAPAERPHREKERDRRARKESDDLSSFRISNCPPNTNKLSYRIILRVIDITMRIPSWMRDLHR